MKGKLIRLTSQHRNLRTDFVDGEYAKVPTVGEHFVLIGESLSFSGGSRLIETSLVQAVEEFTDRYLFATEFSTYELYKL